MSNTAIETLNVKDATPTPAPASAAPAAPVVKKPYHRLTLEEFEARKKAEEERKAQVEANKKARAEKKAQREAAEAERKAQIAEKKAKAQANKEKWEAYKAERMNVTIDRTKLFALVSELKDIKTTNIEAIRNLLKSIKDEAFNLDKQMFHRSADTVVTLV